MTAGLGRRPGGLDALVELVRRRLRIVALTGAGISTESGIPDYRGPGGVWKRRPPTIGDFRENPETRRDYWRERFTKYPELAAAEPNGGHLALVALERAGRLRGVITQNIDGLHQKAGSDPSRVFELHGSAHRVRCLDCRREVDAWSIHARQVAGEMVPACEVCGGPLRSATVLFGEPLPAAALDAAVKAASDCDLMLVVGTSLIVNPAARLPALAKQGGAALAIVNRTETQLDALSDACVRGEAGPTLAALVASLE